MAWTGTKDRGSREYTPQDVERVAALMRNHTGPGHAIALDEIAEELRLASRTLRAILADLDGQRFVLAYAGQDESGKVVYCATEQEHADGYTRRLRATAHTMLERAARREAFSRRNLLRRQGGLFD